jgi:hypothetical protein
MRKRYAIGILPSIFIFFERILENVDEAFLAIARKRANPFCGRKIRVLGAFAPSTDVTIAYEPYCTSFSNRVRSRWDYGILDRCSDSLAPCLRLPAPHTGL